VLIDLNASTLDATTKLCEEAGSEVKRLSCDVSSENQVKDLVQSVLSEDGRIDILVNCAGVCGSKPLKLENFKSMWRDMEINLGGVRPSFTVSHTEY